MARAATNSVTNTFTKGMNSDLDKSIRPNDMYLRADNFRVVGSYSDTTGALENVKGNIQITDGVGDTSNGMYLTNQYVIGTKRIQNWLVVWTTSNTANTEGAGDSYIYAFKIIDGIASTDGNVALHPTAYALYPFCIYKDLGNDLNLSTLSRIKAVASYEGEDVAKIYWCDGDRNLVRWMNIFDSGLPDQSVDRFDIIPDAILSKAIIASLTSGDITAGSIQYTYQLYQSKGSETLFAPLSDVINLTADNENLSNSQYYEGSEREDSTGKGVRIWVSNTNVGFDFIRGIAIHYETLNSSPTIRIFDESSIDSAAASTMFLNDSGETLGTYELEDLTVLSRNMFKAEDLETKDDFLFAADIEENYFDIGDYDARSYRFLSGTKTCRLYHDYTGDEINDPYYNCTGGATIAASTWTSVNLAPGALSDDSIADIPETADLVNLFNDYDNDGTGNYQYKCQFDDTTLGASGLNIDITFDTAGYNIDDDITRFDHSSVDVATPHYQTTTVGVYNTSYTGYASPYISHYFAGYMRDETYRFGIVFYDGKGRRSYVRWICDLRMPTQDELEITTLISDNVQANVLFPVFTIKNALPDGASAYQIVRVKREGAVNRNILAQGLLTSTFLVGSVEFPEWLDASDANANDTNEYVFLNSPEISINKNLSYSSGDHLVAVGQTTVSGTVLSVANDGAGGSIFQVNDSDGILPGDSIVIWGFAVETDYNVTHAVTHIPDGTHIRCDATAFVGDDSGFWVKYGGVYKNTGQGSEIVISKISDWVGHPLATTTIDVIDNCQIIEPNKQTYDFGGANAVSGWHWDLTLGYFKGTSLLVKHSGSGTWDPANDTISDNYRFLCNYRRNNWLSQYGGNTYEDRSRNIYQAAGTIETAIGADDVYGGDTYICYFDYFNLISDLAQVATEYATEGIMFPVETSINCNLRHDKSSLNKLLPADNAWTIQKIEMTQETGGLHLDNTAVTPLQYDQETDLYLYNTVYSQENITIPFIAKPVEELYSITDTFITRIKYSDRKIDGEISDSWFKFRSNNFIDLDKESGPINNIKLYKNGLYFWQDHAFGMLFINPRALLGTEEGSSLVLGTGGFLETADYISRTIGNVNKFGIVATDQSIYWVDNEHRDMIRFTGGMRGGGASGSKLESLSFEKGLSQYIRNRGYIADAQLAYDQMNKEIFVTLTSGRSGTVGTLSGVDFVAVDGVGLLAYDFVIVDGKYFYLNDPFDTEVELTDISEFYSAGDNIFMGPEQDKSTFSFLEKINTFGSFYSFTPGLYNDEFEYLITNSASDSLYLWCHEKGNRGQFYGTYYDSGVYVTFNPEFPYTKVFDNLLWFTEVIDESGTYDINRFNDTWDKVTFYNDYQNSKELTMGFRTGALPYDRRERGFSAAVPRSAVDVDVSDNLDKWTNTDLTQMYRERMRDKYLIGHFYYINGSANYRFICPYITMKYRRSIR